MQSKGRGDSCEARWEGWHHRRITKICKTLIRKLVDCYMSPVSDSSGWASYASVMQQNALYQWISYPTRQTRAKVQMRPDCKDIKPCTYPTLDRRKAFEACTPSKSYEVVSIVNRSSSCLYMRKPVGSQDGVSEVPERLIGGLAPAHTIALGLDTSARHGLAVLLLGWALFEK
jgi:hypothetical protein